MSGAKRPLTVLSSNIIKKAKTKSPATINDFFTKKEKTVESASKFVVTEKSKSGVAPLAYKSRKSTTVETKIEDAVTKPFDKLTWVTSLTDEQRQLLDLEINTMDESWLGLLHSEITKDYFLNLKRFLKSQWDQPSINIFPPKEDIYSWTRLTPVDKVHVLILGQDPYHNFNQAHGLAFSVKDPNTKPPPSLKNIYKCLKIDYPDFEIPKTGDLTKWAEQGVLMLNTCLTVKAHNANSHAKRGWEEFTTAAVKKMIQRHESEKKGIVLMAWGSPAQKVLKSVGFNDEINCYLQSVHPSPLSASRGFFQCQHFIKCNDWLYEKYGKSGMVDWSLVEGKTLEYLDKKE